MTDPRIDRCAEAIIFIKGDEPDLWVMLFDIFYTAVGRMVVYDKDFKVSEVLT